MSSASSNVVSHQGMCMPCQLCLQSNTKMRHMYQTKEHPQLNVVYVWLTSEKPTIKEGDCLCLPCVKQIQRNYNKPKYIPLWLPKAECEKKCSIESCKALVETTTSQMTVNELEDILHERVCTFTMSACATKQSIGLCKKHYNKMYSILNQKNTIQFLRCTTKERKSRVFFPDIVHHQT